MAIIQMWPQNQGLRNSVSFAGRAYSSIPGVSIPVPDFDAGVLQANGWTTYATIAGKNTITMLPPAGLTISFDGRQYTTPPGVGGFWSEAQQVHEKRIRTSLPSS